jgi:hypothetical protein
VASAPGFSGDLPQQPQRGVALVRTSEPVEAGDVLVADRAEPGVMRRGDTAADSLLVGIVVAPQAGTALARGEALVALSGSVFPCRVDATFGAIHAGDLLTTSPNSGRAMRAIDAAPGTIVGKALADFEQGEGTIEVLVMLR